MQATASFACLDGTNYGYQRNPRNMGMTLLFAILTIIILQKRFVQKLQHIRPLLRAHILIKICVLTSVGVFVQARII